MSQDLDQQERDLDQQLARLGSEVEPGRRAALLVGRASVRRARAQQVLDPGHGGGHGHDHGHRSCEGDPRADLRGAWADLAEALAIYAEAPEPRMEAAALSARSGLRRYVLYAVNEPGLLEPGTDAEHQQRAAEQDLEAAITCFRSVGDLRGPLLLLHSEGQRLLYLGEQARAEAVYRRAEPLSLALGDAWSLRVVADGLARARAGIDSEDK